MRVSKIVDSGVNSSRQLVGRKKTAAFSFARFFPYLLAGMGIAGVFTSQRCASTTIKSSSPPSETSRGRKGQTPLAPPHHYPPGNFDLSQTQPFSMRKNLSP